jgi:hypothetical protein
MRYLGKVKVKGRRRPIDLYEIVDGLPEAEGAIKLLTKPDFERALKAYQTGKFQLARQSFQAVLAVHEEDLAARRYEQRAAERIGQVAPEDWEGVEVMEGK